jgi:hypothetical protein
LDRANDEESAAMPQPKFAAPVETLLASMTLEVVLRRFLVREKIIDRDRLLACLNERVEAWQETASEEVMAPILMLMAGIVAADEPTVPQTLH